MIIGIDTGIELESSLLQQKVISLHGREETLIVHYIIQFGQSL
jgi:hypothetical protein